MQAIIPQKGQESPPQKSIQMGKLALELKKNVKNQCLVGPMW